MYVELADHAPTRESYDSGPGPWTQNRVLWARDSGCGLCPGAHDRGLWSVNSGLRNVSGGPWNGGCGVWMVGCELLKFLGVTRKQTQN